MGRAGRHAGASGAIEVQGMSTNMKNSASIKAPQAGSSPRPLDGITVVSLEHAIAAPFCTRQLADLGARVIKVERPGVGDFARGYDERVKGLSDRKSVV